MIPTSPGDGQLLQPVGRSARSGAQAMTDPALRDVMVDDAPTLRATWADAATGLVDAVVGVWRAPVPTSAPGR